jgi:hypothetical protein
MHFETSAAGTEGSGSAYRNGLGLIERPDDDGGTPKKFIILSFGSA